jgi:hypothetical protein
MPLKDPKDLHKNTKKTSHKNLKKSKIFSTNSNDDFGVKMVYR